MLIQNPSLRRYRSHFLKTRLKQKHVGKALFRINLVDNDLEDPASGHGQRWYTDGAFMPRFHHNKHLSEVQDFFKNYPQVARKFADRVKEVKNHFHHHDHLSVSSEKTSSKPRLEITIDSDFDDLFSSHFSNGERFKVPERRFTDNDQNDFHFQNMHLDDWQLSLEDHVFGTPNKTQKGSLSWHVELVGQPSKKYLTGKQQYKEANRNG